MSTSMRAAGVEVFGGDVRGLELSDPPEPGPDELVISVRAAGVGNWDEIARTGVWDLGRRPPLALGVEAAGVVVEAGAAAAGLAPGDEVLTHPVPLRHQGAWAEQLLAPAGLVARKPASLAWEVAAAFPVPALTADQALDAVAPVPGEHLLVNGAGVTGSLVVQLAAARGAIVVATAGPASAAHVKACGADVVLDYHDPGWPAEARGATPGGRGFAAAVNAARGGEASALQALADGGRLATITGDPPAPVRGVSVANVYVQADGPRLASLAGRLAAGELSLRVGLSAPLDEARAALEAVVAGRVPGAAVLVPASPAS